MQFRINETLLAQARTELSQREKIYWIVGGAGSGKTTICRALSARLGLPVYDMDEHIYGSYHGRFTAQGHPVNHAWSSSPDGLAWLLDLTWEEFNAFNQAALPEYLNLLCDDLRAAPPEAGLLIDGGICNPAVLARAFPAERMVCLAVPGRSSEEIWNETEERRSMQEVMQQLPDPAAAWRRFLEFDEKITATILKECRESAVTVISRDESEPVEALAERTARALGLGVRPFD